MIEPQRAMVDPGVQGVIVVAPGQSGKTDTILNIIGHRADEAPTPILYVGPARDFVEDEFSPRLETMLQSTSALWAKVAQGKKNKKTRKLVSGTEIRMAWAGSAKRLAGFPAGLAIFDERDQADTNLKKQGDPFEMVRARGRTYPGFHWLVAGTITNGNVSTYIHPETGFEHWEVAKPDDVQSPTWKLWQEGTREERAWPCLRCGEYFIPRMKLLRWPKGATPDEAETVAWVECPKCAAHLTDADRPAMMEWSVYVSPGQRVTKERKVVGEGIRSGVRSFWVSGLAVAWTTFGTLARDWLAAVRSGDQGRVQGVLNLGFNELYSLKGEAPAWERVGDLREGYLQGQVHANAIALTCAVDVQKLSLYFEIRAWTYGMVSWLVRADQLFGETEHPPIWDRLEELLLSEVDGRRLDVMLVDSGFRPGKPFSLPMNRIYDFCRRFPGLARPTKGRARQEKPIKPSLIDVNVDGQIVKDGLQLWLLDTDYFKTWVHGAVRPRDPDAAADSPVPPRRWRLPSDVSDDYCQQLVAEARLVTPSGSVKWIKLRQDNHYGDCAAMNVAAAYMLELHLVSPPRPGEEPEIEAPRTHQSRWARGG
jgi:phage terminase large subunit GpA-like protein